jgi:ribosomal protein L1
VIESVAERKPEEGLKGRYVKKVSIASTMGPGIVLDPTEVQAIVDAVG